jgi:hypothetical protein
MLEKSMNPDGSAALDFILANLDYQNGQLDEAVDYYGRALGKFPDFRRAHKNLGLLHVHPLQQAWRPGWRASEFSGSSERASHPGRQAC